MTTAELLGESPADTTAPILRRCLRIAACAAFGAVLAWLLVPILVFGGGGGGGGDEDPGSFYRTAAQIADERWTGAYQLLAFGGVGFALLVLVVALQRATELRPLELEGVGAGVGARLGLPLGLLAAGSYLLYGGLQVGFYAFGDNIGEVTGDESLQRVSHVVVETLSTGVLTTGVIGLAGWLVWFATRGRRAGLAGWPAVALATGYGLAFVVPVALWSMPMVAVTLQPVCCLLLGVGLLIRARRLGRSRTTVAA